MSTNTLFLYQVDDPTFQQLLQNYSTNYFALHFVQLFENATEKEMHTKVEQLIVTQDINHLCILFNNCDASLDLYWLEHIKNSYNLKTIFIFQNSHNSFEYIDRYYAQIADLIIIPPVEYLDDFYNALEIKNFTLESLESDLTIKKENIFASSLTNLSTPQRKISHQQDEATDLFALLDTLRTSKKEILTDKKFLYSQRIYKIFWAIYNLQRYKKSKFIFSLLQYKNLFYLKEIYLLYRTLLRSQSFQSTNPIELINKALYKEYRL
ncbi:MAG: hypothetical protein FAF05_03920 [Epsilonproteobacteria bacterium]|nr:hypothetical protein [Campylobacterota bacterium]